MHLHYGGTFGEYGYYDGEVSHKLFNTDTIVVVRFDVWAMKLGQFGSVTYYLRHPKKDYKSGLKILENDAYVFKMALYTTNAGEVDVYVRHLTNEEVEEARNPRKNRLVIEEINNDNEETTGPQ